MRRSFRSRLLGLIASASVRVSAASLRSPASSWYCASALNYLGYLLASRGEQLDEAIRLVQKALEAEPDNPAYLDSLGWAYFRKGDLDGAEKNLSAAAQKLPENSEIQDHLGDLHARRQRWSEAIAAWTRALGGDGEGIDKAAVEKKIGNAKGKMQNAK